MGRIRTMIRLPLALVGMGLLAPTAHSGEFVVQRKLVTDKGSLVASANVWLLQMVWPRHWARTDLRIDMLAKLRKLHAGLSVPAALFALLLCTVCPAAAPNPSPALEPPHVAIEARSDQQTVAPGQTFLVAVVEHIEPGWHTYWINPGDAGQATKLSWTLPDGYRIGTVQWPVPQVFRSGTIVTYGYEGQVVLLQEVYAPRTLASSPAKLSVEAQWLACQDICIPEHAQAQLIVRQGATDAPIAASGSMTLFSAARARLPRPSPWSSSLVVDAANVVVTVHGIARNVPSARTVQFLPLTWGEIDNAAVQRIERSGADLMLTLRRGDLREAPLSSLDGILLVGPESAGAQRQGYLLHALASGAQASHSR
jgi:thiol:disulfide interchange protein DsbD